MADSALAWDLLGIPVVIIGGTLLHFCFEWSGRRRVLAVLCPINESVWEHLKMAYWPLLVMTAVQMAASEHPPALAAARAVGFYTMCALILGLYVLTAALLPHADMRTRLLVDGSIFIVAVVVGLCVSYAGSAFSGSPVVVWTGWVALLAPMVVFAWTTYAPPHVALFRDQITGGYGLDQRR
ncbi:DUF6512 family protein [Mycolicibacterium hippocampi]|uniref:Uncharacterized protein n=1 Tax=Mycolicibacterium hippocampi TaxID=659824 RepID=A0A850PTR5_9MYCO|nr:DUF6512 family protein [Mycolicibacterium hippocampi]NVN50976.1 hypothetical protein [Mycolicibacterium hippocampi]